ncbi:MAG TPA: twin-arginine translocation pathway signal protein [Desulfuromonadales bacterium]|nr:twin-arginine translocation pathway signal protein [Desulfuromonadales bacterium]
MMNTSRRAFFKTFLSAGAALAVSGTVAHTGPAEAAIQGQITGVCLYVPSLGKASEFVEMMNNNAPGNWTVHPLQGTLTEYYFTTRLLYEEARGSANTFVGVVDPATFAVVHEAIVDSSGSFHYITYQDSNRITFSVQL